jgi:SAM-dependent methyltransferase
MSCLDVGCGIGAVTFQLARRVGPSGRAVGIDRDEHCLEIARQEAGRQSVHPVFQTMSVSELQETAAYDLVYSRFLLSHLREPGQAIERMALAARPGGLVVVEDIEFAGHFSFPVCPAFDRYVSLYQQAVERKGGNANIGPRLPGLFLDAGVEQVDLEVVQPTFRHGPGKRIAQVTMEHIREAVVEAGLASPGEVDAVVADLDRFAQDPRTLLSLPRIFQVWGRRPHAGAPALQSEIPPQL